MCLVEFCCVPPWVVHLGNAGPRSSGVVSLWCEYLESWSESEVVGSEGSHQEVTYVCHLHHFLCCDGSSVAVWVVDSHDSDDVGVLGGVFAGCLQHERCIRPQDLVLVVHFEVIRQLLSDVGLIEKVVVKHENNVPIGSVEGYGVFGYKLHHDWSPGHACDHPPEVCTSSAVSALAAKVLPSPWPCHRRRRK